MAWERRTHVSLANAFVSQLVLPGGVEQWVCHPNFTLDLVSAPHLVHAGDSNTVSTSPCVLLCAPPALTAEQAREEEQVEHPDIRCPQM